MPLGTSLSLTDLTGLFPAPDRGYGVYGDGSHDDAAGLTALIAAAAASNGGSGANVIMLPTTAGYKLASNVTVPSGVNLIIEQGVTLSGAGAIVTSGTGAILDFRSGLKVTGVLSMGAGQDFSARRYKSNGTALVAGDFGLSAGWGTTASVAVAAGSTDDRGQITVTSAGAGQGANPTITLTFHDGTFGAQAPFAVAQAQGGTGVTAAVGVNVSTTATTLVLTPLLTPVAASTYIFGWKVEG